MKRSILALLSFFIWTILPAQTARKGFELIARPGQKQVDIVYNGHLLTAYCYTDSIAKPFLYPVNTLGGITVTRGFPVKPIPGESTDHPHHVGIWMNYESVNGIDFWNNSSAIPAAKKAHYGTILHQKIRQQSASGNKASLQVTATWVNQAQDTFLNEQTTYFFEVTNNRFYITRKTTLTALRHPVVFKDVKDGFFAIRLAKELEMPSTTSKSFTDDKGNVTTVAASGPGVPTGMYYASNGKTGDTVWSSQGTWAMLKGKKDGAPITIAMFDHPSNTGYPTYWHARGYGLFALNPLGRAVFSNGSDSLNLVLPPGRSKTFTYRIVIAQTELTIPEANEMDAAFKQLRF
ncbi:MAG: PmoA family protein [Niabella sp.]|nr:PmoA family protein [Niabella sp.]